MNKSFDMVILTKSSKFHENCVAGVDCETGELVRLVTDNAEKHGALSYEDLIMDNGAPAMPLYIVHVQNAEKVHGDIQTENYRIDRRKRLQFIKRMARTGSSESFNPVRIQKRKGDSSLTLRTVRKYRVTKSRRIKLYDVVIR